MKQNTRQALATAARSATDQQAGLTSPMTLEPLEDRRLMTATPGAAVGPISLSSGGVLTLAGSKTTENLLRVDLGGTGGNKVLQADVNGTFQSFAATSVKEIHITGGAGNDFVYVDPRVGTPTSIVTGAGSDTIRGGLGHDTINAGPGDDAIYTHGSDNVIHGGTGTNTVNGVSNKKAVDSAGNEVRVGGLANTHLYTKTKVTASKATTTKVTTKASAKASAPLTKTITASAATTSEKTTSTTTTVAKSTGLVATGTTTTGTLKTNGTTTNTTVSATVVGAKPVVVTVAAPTAGPTAAPTPTGTTVAAPVAKPVATPVATPTATPVATPVAKPVSQPVAKPVAQTTPTPTPTTTVLPATVIAGGTPAADLAALSAPINPGGVTADGKPVAVLDLLPGIRQTGLVVNVDGLNSKVGTGTCITTNYSWDFGDGSGAHDQMTGYNAAHVYDTPGTYTVTLTVTNQDGQKSVAQGQVTIAASTRQQVFVDAVNGNDANAGTSASAPMKSLAAAFAKLGNNTEILMRAGETFTLTDGININSSNVLIGRYGAGADPVLMRAAGYTEQAFQTFQAADGVTIEHIAFDSPNAVSSTSVANKTGVCGIYLRGSNLTIRNCTFLNIDDAVNEAGDPGGALVEDNTAPLVTGLRGYMVWAQGDRGTIIGNTVANSTREHCIRLEWAAEVTIEDNTLSNLNRTTTGDAGDISKGCIEMQQGSYGWIAGNSVTDGDIRIGPRGATGIYGETATSSTDWCVIQDNQLTDTFVFVQPGAHDAMIEDNVILENTVAQAAISINGTDGDGRTAMDITIRNNTAVQSGVSGNFLRINGYCSGVSLYNNLYVAPQLQIMNNGACAVYVNQPNLSCFSEIGHNVWPSATQAAGKWGAGGAEYVGTDGVTAADWLTPSQWDAESEVNKDVLQDVDTADLAAGTYQLAAASSSTGVAAGAPLSRAA